jgi:hypothetical protein
MKKYVIKSQSRLSKAGSAVSSLAISLGSVATATAVTLQMQPFEIAEPIRIASADQFAPEQLASTGEPISNQSTQGVENSSISQNIAPSFGNITVPAFSNNKPEKQSTSEQDTATKPELSFPPIETTPDASGSGNTTSPTGTSSGSSSGSNGGSTGNTTSPTGSSGGGSNAGENSSGNTTSPTSASGEDEEDDEDEWESEDD